ncbi:MAG: hypothetical protein ACW981_08610 [Candidatus Hodarchaeales archaeon]|jgi:hypothetical protein
MISPERKELFKLNAQFYEDHGLPGLSGWIDTLLILEPLNPASQPWTQKSLSERLTTLFPKRQYPTSVPSINRVIKINENYGTIERKGNHKDGYTYWPKTGYDVIISVFENFVSRTEYYISKMKGLKKETQKNDEKFTEILQEQILGYEIYKQMLELVLDQVDSFVGGNVTNTKEE